MTSNNSVRRTQSQVLAKTLAAIGRKYQHHINAAGTATIIVMQSMPSYGWGLFDSAQTAMTCMFGGAGGIGGGGAAAATTAIKALPAVINATITVLLFVYFVASGLKVANGIGEVLSGKRPYLFWSRVFPSVPVFTRGYVRYSSPQNKKRAGSKGMPKLW